MEHAPKRVTLFCGHYGSGKTNLAVNYALHMAKAGLKVSIGDLDIVNPYYRTKDSAAELAAAGVDLISLPYANTNVDLPALPSEMYRLVQDRSRHAVFDIGGDDRGAYALGRFSDAIREENDFENLFVVNFRRPLTPNAASAMEIMQEIICAGKLPFTGIVNNTNLGALTTTETILESIPEAEALSQLCSLPIVFTGVDAALLPELSQKILGTLPMHLQKRPV